MCQALKPSNSDASLSLRSEYTEWHTVGDTKLGSVTATVFFVRHALFLLKKVCYWDKIFATCCMKFSWFEFVCPGARIKSTQVSNSYHVHCFSKLSPLQRTFMHNLLRVHHVTQCPCNIRTMCIHAKGLSPLNFPATCPRKMSPRVGPP